MNNPLQLARIRRWIPEGTRVSVVGDKEFGSVALMRQLETWGWDDVLHQKSSTLVFLPTTGTWLALEEVLTAPGQSHWHQDVLLTERHRHRCHLLAHWEPGEDNAWFLATSYATRGQTLRAYRRHTWSDEMHRDLKSQGFHLDKTHIWDGRVLSRFFLALVLLYVWSTTVGIDVIKRSLRYLVDRRHHRILRVFRIGHDMLMRHLGQDHPLPIRLLPYFR